MASKEPRGKPEPRSFNLADVRALAKLVDQFDLTELELQRKDERLRIRREHPGAQPAVAAQPAVQVPAAPPVPSGPPHLAIAPAVDAGESTDDGSVIITSPFVGTFYRAPSPEASPFVEVGQTVSKGQVLCIVEAMKLMNEIEAETDCKILEIIAKNTEPVEFGQPLYRVFPIA